MTPSGGSAREQITRLSRRIPQVRLQARMRHGARRVRRSFFPILQAAIGASIAFAIARYGLGHELPFFAPIATWVCLGFTPDRRLRKVAELATGVALGVGVGDLMVTVIGTGPWQIAFVLLLATAAARFLDRGLMLTMQAGVQAIVVVALPVQASGGPMTRWVDALIGGLMALAAAALLPGDPRKRPRDQVNSVLRELGDVLNDLSRSLIAGDDKKALRTLERARSMQPPVDEMHAVLRGARETVTVSPTMRKYRGEIQELSHMAVVIDRAVRNARVMARRAVPLTENHHDLPVLADLVRESADATYHLRRAVMAAHQPMIARNMLISLAEKLGPEAAELKGGSVITLIVLLRSLTVDLLQATGLTSKQARGHLPGNE